MTDPLGGFLHRRALKAVARRMPGEVEKAVQATRDGRPGLLVATREHVGWVRERRLGPARCEARPITDLQRLRLDEGILLLGWEEGHWALHGVRPASAKAMAQHLRKHTGRLLHEDEARFHRTDLKRQQRVARLVREGGLSEEEAEWALR